MEPIAGMFERWRVRRQNREIVDRVYDAIVARAREPALYVEGGLPDTVMGRYEALGIELLLLLDRCRTEPGLSAFSQDLVDRFMLDMDHSLREIGIGYQSVPKRMRKLANRFYTRVANYREPLELRDRTRLEAALVSRAYGDVAPSEGAAAFLAAHMLCSARAYETVPVSTFLSGRLEETAEEPHGR